MYSHNCCCFFVCAEALTFEHFTFVVWLIVTIEIEVERFGNMFQEESCHCCFLSPFLDAGLVVWSLFFCFVFCVFSWADYLVIFWAPPVCMGFLRLSLWLASLLVFFPVLFWLLVFGSFFCPFVCCVFLVFGLVPGRTSCGRISCWRMLFLGGKVPEMFWGKKTTKKTVSNCKSRRDLSNGPMLAS